MRSSLLLAALLLLPPSLHVLAAPAPARGGSDAGRPLKITGTNGKTVEFAGVLEVRPEALVGMPQVGKPTVVVPWSQVDLLTLELQEPAIYKAYQKARGEGRSVLLKLGAFAGLVDPEEAAARIRRLLEKTVQQMETKKKRKARYVVEKYSRFERLTRDQVAGNHRYYKSFRSSLEEEVIDELKKLLREIPNPTFYADDQPYLDLPRRLQRLVGALERAFVQQRPLRSEQDEVARFLGYLYPATAPPVKKR